MPRGDLDLQNPADLAIVGARWKFAGGLGARRDQRRTGCSNGGHTGPVANYDDSGLGDNSRPDQLALIRPDLCLVPDHRDPPRNGGRQSIEGGRCMFENLHRTTTAKFGWTVSATGKGHGTGVNVPQRVVVSDEPKPGTNTPLRCWRSTVPSPPPADRCSSALPPWPSNGATPAANAANDFV